MDSVYKYSVCHRWRPRPGGNVGQNDLGQQQWSDGWTANWCPSDNRPSWDKRKSWAERLGWTDSNVKYRFNEYGYRHQGAFVKNKNSLVALGCSLTFGIGVNYEQTWPYYVAKELGLDCINLGQPGTGINASYRAAKMWLPVIKPKVVMFYVPDAHRRELWPYPDANRETVASGRDGPHPADSVQNIGPWHQGDDHDNKLLQHFKMTMSGRETAIFREAYIDAMKWISRDYLFIDFPSTEHAYAPKTDADNLNDMIIVDAIHNIAEEHHPEHRRREKHGIDPVRFTPNTVANESRWARDMMHPGPRVMRDNIAPLFIKAYNES